MLQIGQNIFFIADPFKRHKNEIPFSVPTVYTVLHTSLVCEWTLAINEDKTRFRSKWFVVIRLRCDRKEEKFRLKS